MKHQLKTCLANPPSVITYPTFIRFNYIVPFERAQKRWGFGHRDLTNYYPQDDKVWENKWHFVAMRRRGSIARLFIDGEPIGNDHSLNNAALAINPGGIVFGQVQDSVGGSFDIRQSFWGEIDNLLFYERVLTEEEIITLAEMGNQTPNLQQGRKTGNASFAL